MWLLAMFDLPVKSGEDRREYVRFQKGLLEEGFMRIQYSVYVRYSQSEEASLTLRRRIRARLPSGGQVRLLAVTDHQFGKMEIFEGKIRREGESAPDQLMLF
jgi:CRISPR-associated protein Cas2